MSETPDTPLTANYDNNNEANAIKMKQQRLAMAENKNCNSTKRNNSPKHRICSKLHLNSLWSVWYGFLGTFLQAYTAVKCTKRFLRYSILQWTSQTAVWELQACFLVTGFAVLLLPFFLAAAVFKVGNLANDGFKLGRTNTFCEKDPKTSLLGPKCSLWKHGAPTASFIHLLIAFIFLVPKLVMEARLIEAGFLPNEAIWRTDLDFMIVHHDRLVVLSFMTATSPNTSTSLPLTTAQLEIATNANVINVTKQQAALPHSLVKILKDFLNIDSSESSFDAGFGSSVSVEYMNYALALFVYSVRYPAVFWNTNKCFGIIFSIQLLANSLQSLLAFAGMSVLYKVQIIGAWKALPFLRHYPDGMSPLGGKSPFLLNTHVTLALFTLSSLLVLSSSLILYLYGHGRFNSFLNQQRTRKHIFISRNSLDASHSSWGYFTHCAALCVLAAVSVTYAPLLYDYTVVYRGSLDGAVLACIIASILHLFLWVLVWLLLTVKQKWGFKLRVTVGRATVRSARSVKLVTDVSLSGTKPENSSAQPLLVVVGNGRAYAVTDPSPKRAIMEVVQRTSKSATSSNNSTTTVGSETIDDDTEEQIYWLRPALVNAKKSPTIADSTGGESPETKLCWFSKTNSHAKPKVTFNEATSTSNMRNNKEGSIKPKVRPGGVSKLDEDDGDYATLRELPIIASMVRNPEDDNTSEEGKLLSCFHDENVTYASTSRDLLPPIDYEDPSPLLTPEPLNDRTNERNDTTNTNNNTNSHSSNITVHTQVVGLQTPRCLRRADSGMPPEELTPRSGTSSPPEAISSNHSESSSGIHSNASSEPNHQNTVEVTQQNPSSRRATSVANLVQVKDEHQWKSSSLQRGLLPQQMHVIGSNSSTNANNSQNSGNISSNTASTSINTQQKRLFGIKNEVGYGYIDKESLKNVLGQRNNSTAIKINSNQTYCRENDKNVEKTETCSSSFKPSTVRSNSSYGYTDLPTNNPTTQRYSTDITDLTKTAQLLSKGNTNSHFNALYGYVTKTITDMSENSAANNVNLSSNNSSTSSTVSNTNSSTSKFITNETDQNAYFNNQNSVNSESELSQKPVNTFYNSSQSISGGIPAVILENACENTVVIRRKMSKPTVNDVQIPVISEEPFGRSTNMKMISFTEHKDLKNIQASSATLPIYPTQPIHSNQYVHCSTMPLPHNSNSQNVTQSLGQNTTSCNLYPRQHTTIPTHHNGVRLFSNQSSPVKRQVNFQRSISEK